MKKVNRRYFVMSSAKGVAGFSAAAALTAGGRVAAAPANDRVSLALIGCGGRGTSLIRRFAKRTDLEVTCLCDLDNREGGALPKQVGTIQGNTPKRVFHYQKVLDDKDIDAVVVATPDHWHAPLTVFACQAGKDVYVEKPPSHNLWEGRKMVEAARKYKRVVQVGTQCRSAPYIYKAIDYIKSGGLGDIPLCKVYNLKPGGPYKARPDSKQPEGVDWYTWLGPAEMRPYNDGIIRGGWHNYWDFSGGDMAGDGIHQLDVARWLIGKAFARSAHCYGGRLAFPDDDAQTPDTASATFDMNGTILTLEETAYAPYMAKTPVDMRDRDEFPHWPLNSTRIELYGTKRLMILGRHGGGWQVFEGGGKVVAQEHGRPSDDPHQEDFLQCIRSRKLPNADIEEGHRSMALIHLANISCRVGGRAVKFDAKTETIVGDDEANKLIKGKYREPFVVPEEV